MSAKTPGGLSGGIKQRLIQQALERRRNGAGDSNGATLEQAQQAALKVPEAFYRFDLYPGYQQMQFLQQSAARMGLGNPFFRLHDGLAGAQTCIGGQDYVNFASYNYLGYSGHPVVVQAAKDAIDRYGTSVSASRVVSGDRPLHRELERELASFYEVDDAVVFVSGHATNVTTIGYLFGPRDLVLHDELVHNSVLQGIQLSGARRLSFAHNDWQALDRILGEQRQHFERVLVVVEGIYSMDGDYPDLPRFVELKRKHKIFLMVDEAHSLGVMGATGRGIREHFGLAGDDVDIWMGTLSKTLASCGGYIAGNTALVEHLKFLAPGFLYSVGLPPSVTASALAALRCLINDHERVQAVQARGEQFLRLAREAGLDTATSTGLAVIPVITGSSLKAGQLSSALFERGINAQPILYPAVPEKTARVRFFVSCEHTQEQISRTVAIVAEELARLD
ncbi:MULTISPECIES: aminotransferase class I/II-fold pyridoxal phosphate-dependent enzyme [Pseudomonas]|uniref:aminotransferase class I/II-fold pyridoxal phosphate-dependent enzyme n=1 Tax=Pseudomonas TaxID=286 RepID=UPI000497BA5A|nr:8-amino-7-oxononanoate synthase [Pseudomonas fragi]AUB77587.1 8-amino-7-oxononanoate synthase [Pseudomonas sp. Lz4W]MCH4871233.1 aminotransferase class I/II-fold pyridoxal phosphate-dependent enzyme [Pseudomonas sp. TMW22089]NBG92851.1 aminotransferase class I/II-fold pyridoxal phosphate-dependent enzyme [Pseudomonas sp. 9.1(2019)]